MDTNRKQENESNLIYPKLSYDLVGICFDVQNELVRYAREKQYADTVEERHLNKNLNYEREKQIGSDGNIIDFVVGDKIILKLKACPRITKGHFNQTQNYLQSSLLKLALLVNFRESELKPRRVVRTDRK